MPSLSSSTQRSKIQQLVLVTSATDRTATRFLKATDWNVDQAADAFFRSQSASAASSASSASATSALNKLFDRYRDSPADAADLISIEGAMRYMSDLSVRLDEPVVLAIGELLQSPTIGEFSRSGFVAGWKTLGSADTLDKQIAQIARLRAALPSSPTLFRRVYRHTFTLARLPGQTKAIPLDAAIEYWRLLFSGPPHAPAWTGATTAWLHWWLDFLRADWKRGVNRDMWNMTHEFYVKSMDPGQGGESMAWWDENGAWPGVLDDFVVYVKERRRTEGIEG